MNKAPQMLSIKETCGLLGIGRTLAHRLMKDGRLEFVKLGKRTLIPLEAVARLVEDAKRQS